MYVHKKSKKSPLHNAVGRKRTLEVTVSNASFKPKQTTKWGKELCLFRLKHGVWHGVAVPKMSFKWFLPAFLPSFHLGLHYSSITQHPSNSSFLSSLVPAKSKVTRDSLTRVLKTFQFALLKPIKIYFSSRHWKKNQLWLQVSTKRKKFTKKIHGYCL